MNRILKQLVLAMLLTLPMASNAQFTFTTNNGAITITGYTGSSGVVSIPNTINGLPVTRIGDWAFYLTSITNILIPNSITSIGYYSFGFCTSLTNVILPNSITSIDTHAFENCSSLTGVTLPNSVASIPDYAFAFCTKLRSVTIPNGVTHIGNYVFYYCPGLTNITIPNSVTSIGGEAFYYSGLTSLTLPNSVTSIGIGAFFHCAGLTSVSIPTNITSIENEVFSYCSGLTSVTVPTGVNSIGNQAFSHDTNLAGIFFYGNAPSIVDASTFDNSTNVTVYYLPGRTGWNTTLAGRPTALWLPLVKTPGTGFGGQTNQFGFNIQWAVGQTVVVEACTNLSAPVWQSLFTNVLMTGLDGVSDPKWTNYSSRFYRLRSP